MLMMKMQNNKKGVGISLLLKFCIYLQINIIDAQTTSAKVLTPVAICIQNFGHLLFPKVG